MTLPLSKCYDPADYTDLAEELAIVDKIGIDGQHECRRWEYAMALRAQKTWEQQTAAQTRRQVDVGGGGSTFRNMTSFLPYVVDPGETCSLQEYLDSRPNLADVVTCISVLEHVDDLDEFCYHLSCLVAPGGLLFLTFDYTPIDHTIGWPEDRCHFHWMRQRIFNEWARGDLHGRFCTHHLSHLGDIGGRGTAVIDDWGYAPASLALVKRR